MYLIILLVVLFSNAAHADWYLGADSIELRAIPDLYSISNSHQLNIDENTETSFSLFGGYSPNKYFSLELEYQDDLAFGVDDMFAGSSLWFPDATIEDFDSNALFLSGISSYNVTDSGTFYMKGGIFNWETTTRSFTKDIDEFDRSEGTDIFYGLGANYDLNARFQISAEWERYQMEASDIDFLSTEFKFKF